MDEIHTKIIMAPSHRKLTRDEILDMVHSIPLLREVDYVIAKLIQDQLIKQLRIIEVDTLWIPRFKVELVNQFQQAKFEVEEIISMFELMMILR